MMPYATLAVEREDGFAVVTLNRPPANTISAEVVTELERAVAELEADDALRAVIVTGAGDRIFCGGADLTSAFSGGPGADLEAFLRRGHAVLRRIELCPKPVIAAIQGHATGGGCELAMACHIRLMKETARIGQTESNLGILPGWGGTQRLPRLVGRGRALELLILGTQIPAPEALALGLVNRLTREGETLNEAKALARAIARRPPVATRLIIRCVDRALTAPLDEGVDAEIRAILETLRTEDAAEGIQAFLQKRAPEFKGR
jgi:enoyl-CoA hydratase/carnithine racemase